jgi:hypothetical protein
MIREKLLREALRDFTNAMARRLSEKEREGYKGWNKENVITTKTLLMNAHVDLGEVWQKPKSAFIDEYLVDIANFMFMVWFRVYGKRAMKRRQEGLSPLRDGE